MNVKMMQNLMQLLRRWWYKYETPAKSGMEKVESPKRTEKRKQHVSLTTDLEEFLRMNYDVRFNVLTEQAEVRKKWYTMFRPVNQRMANTICLDAREAGINCWDKDVLRLLNSERLEDFHPRDVGIMGFSAGGHLASVISTHSDYEVRPDFTILFYPVISMDEKVTHKYSCRNFLGEEGQKDKELVRRFSTQNAVKRHLTPPALIISANDDRLVPFVTNGLAYYTAMRKAGNECTMHVYPTGDHGFGFGHWFKYHDQLLADLGVWLDNLQTPAPDAIRVACIGNSITDGSGIDMASMHGYPASLQQLLGKEYWVKNFGVSGRTMLNKGDRPYMKEMAWRDALAFQPDVVVIKLGTNDSKPQNWQHGAEFKQDLVQMITELCPELGQLPKNKKKRAKALAEVKTKIFLCTPIPAFKSTWNINDSVIVNGIIPIQQEVAKEYGLQVIDLHTLFGNDVNKMVADGIHPNEKGARHMAEIIADALKGK